jgi:formylmethanofuran dehydrogenase subunit E
MDLSDVCSSCKEYIDEGVATSDGELLCDGCCNQLLDDDDE